MTTEFKSFAEFVQAAYRKEKHGINDERLITKVAAGMSEGGNAGYVVSKPLIASILQSSQAESPIWSAVKKLTTKSFGGKIPQFHEEVRTEAGQANMAFWVGEAVTKTTDYPMWDQFDYTLKKLVTLLPVTDELMQDSQLMQDWVDQFVPKQIAKNVERAILYGDPAISLNGIMGPVSSKGVQECVVASTLTEANIIAMVKLLAPANRKNACWYVSQNRWNQILDLANAGTNFISSEFLYLEDGTALLMGHKVYVMEQMKAPGDICLGDFTQYVVLSMGDAIKDVSIQFKFNLDETYMRWVIRLAGEAFGQVYDLDDGNTVGTFVVPNGVIPFESSSSSSESVGNVSTSSSSSESVGNPSDSSNSSSSSSTSSDSESTQSETSESSSSGDNLEVTGSLNPDATGNYAPVGMKNGQTMYSNGTYFIYYDGVLNYILSATTGIQTNYWLSDTASITGTYSAQGTCTGEATVA